MSRWPCWARVRPAGALWLWTAGTQGHCAVWYCRTPWGALWGARRLHLTGRRPCRLCHGTGVLMSPDCDCGAAGITGIAWGPHEPWCATAPCPRKCPMAASRDEARAVWRDWWPKRERPLMLLTIEDTRVDIPVPYIRMTEVYRRLEEQGYLTAELAGFGTDGELDDLGPFLAILQAEEPGDVQRRMERFRAGMRKMDEDPAERERIERLAAEASEQPGPEGEPGD